MGVDSNLNNIIRSLDTFVPLLVTRLWYSIYFLFRLTIFLSSTELIRVCDTSYLYTFTVFQQYSKQTSNHLSL